MVATHGLRQLQADVSDAEEAELRRLEDGATAGGDGDRQALPQSGGDDNSGDEAGSVGVVVAGAKRRAEQLDSKKFTHGGFRDSFKVTGLQPRGGAGLKAKVPKRKDFGDEGEEGDAAHGAAMKEFSLAEFGCSHVQDRTLDLRMQRVGLFGHWLLLNKYGKHVEWKVSDGKHGKERCVIAVERDGTPRVPSEAAMMEYVLAMATGDAESRPKGGWKEYEMGEHVKPSLHGLKRGELLGKQKEFGTGSYADAPFRFRGIQEQVHAIRWFYDVLLEKLGGGALNPASTSTFKKLMKALSFLMGQRRAYVPNALTREVVEAVCGVVRVDWLEDMVAASLLVGDLVWGARAADLYLTDWAELVFELEKEAQTKNPA